ncbi:unnamed protein product [Periconia digitata]|uniref:Uncharacterized protein n=1 Tax=Periconia digitata TaxID=1303443 RepID=A0A9W4XQA4_9PLEO|nr:unnamed protein product [Periconia digitata]
MKLSPFRFSARQACRLIKRDVSNMFKRGSNKQCSEEIKERLSQVSRDISPFDDVSYILRQDVPAVEPVARTPSTEFAVGVCDSAFASEAGSISLSPQFSTKRAIAAQVAEFAAGIRDAAPALEVRDLTSAHRVESVSECFVVPKRHTNTSKVSFSHPEPQAATVVGELTKALSPNRKADTHNPRDNGIKSPTIRAVESSSSTITTSPTSSFTRPFTASTAATEYSTDPAKQTKLDSSLLDHTILVMMATPAAHPELPRLQFDYSVADEQLEKWYRNLDTSVDNPDRFTYRGVRLVFTIAFIYSEQNPMYERIWGRRFFHDVEGRQKNAANNLLAKLVSSLDDSQPSIAVKTAEALLGAIYEDKDAATMLKSIGDWKVSTNDVTDDLHLKFADMLLPEYAVLPPSGSELGSWSRLQNRIRRGVGRRVDVRR